MSDSFSSCLLNVNPLCCCIATSRIPLLFKSRSVTLVSPCSFLVFILSCLPGCAHNAQEPVRLHRFPLQDLRRLGRRGQGGITLAPNTDLINVKQSLVVSGLHHCSLSFDPPGLLHSRSSLTSRLSSLLPIGLPRLPPSCTHPRACGRDRHVHPRRCHRVPLSDRSPSRC